MYRIDLLCAKIDIIPSPLQSGGAAFVVREDDGAKGLYTFVARVAAYAEEWVLACRRARRDDAISTADLLTCATHNPNVLRCNPLSSRASGMLSRSMVNPLKANPQSPTPQSPNPLSPTHRRHSPLRPFKVLCAYSPSCAQVLLSPRRATLSMEMPKYETDSDQNVMKNAKGEFMGGSTDKILDVPTRTLILTLTLISFFQKVIEGVLDRIAFLRCFPMFIDPEELLKKLCARFLYPTADPKHRTQVVDFLFKWQQVPSLYYPNPSLYHDHGYLQTFPQDFQAEEMQNALLGFVSLGQDLPNLSPDIVPRLTAIAKAAKIVNVCLPDSPFSSPCSFPLVPLGSHCKRISGTGPHRTKVLWRRQIRCFRS